MIWFIFCIHISIGLSLALWEFRHRPVWQFITVSCLGGFLIYAMLIVELSAAFLHKLRSRYDSVN